MATARRRVLIEEILAMLPEDVQRAVAGPAEEAVRPPVPGHPVHANERGRP
jgi:hypothetical protein